MATTVIGLVLIGIGVMGAVWLIVDEWIADDPDDRRSIEARRRRDAALQTAERGEWN